MGKIVNFGKTDENVLNLKKKIAKSVIKNVLITKRS